MSYKPDESVLMAYLYDELSGEEKVLVEKYLLENPTAMKELESLKFLRSMMTHVEDKEVIAPPIVIEDSNQRFFWNAPYLKTNVSIAASLLLLMVAGSLMDIRMKYSDNQVSLSFGEQTEKVVAPSTSGMTPEQVQ